MVIMNDVFQGLLAKMSARFTEISEGALISLILSRLFAMEVEENSETLTAVTADKIFDFFSELSDEQLEEWHWGVLTQKKGPIQRIMDRVVVG